MVSVNEHFWLQLEFPCVLQKTVNATEPEFVEQTIKPFDGSELYIADEAYRYDWKLICDIAPLVQPKHTLFRAWNCRIAATCLP